MSGRARRDELRERIDIDLPAAELARLARVDALLRIAAARRRCGSGGGVVNRRPSR
jgi:hypothetical protein